MKFCRVVANLYSHIFTSHRNFILIFIKMALIILLIAFTTSSFDFHQVKRPWLHRQRWVAFHSPDLNPLDYYIWGQWSLVTSCN